MIDRSNQGRKSGSSSSGDLSFVLMSTGCIGEVRNRYDSPYSCASGRNRDSTPVACRTPDLRKFIRFFLPCCRPDLHETVPYRAQTDTSSEWSLSCACFPRCNHAGVNLYGETSVDRRRTRASNIRIGYTFVRVHNHHLTDQRGYRVVALPREIERENTSIDSALSPYLVQIVECLRQGTEIMSSTDTQL